MLDDLELVGTGACGTVRANRKNLPAKIKPTVLKLKKGDDPVFYRKGNKMTCTWQDVARKKLFE